MATVSRKKSNAGYLKLIDEFPLAPIRSKSQLKSAQRLLDTLLARWLDRGENDYFEVLTQLVEDYESKQEKISPPALADLLNLLMEEHGVSASDVARRTGIAESTISQMRAGKRSCSKVNCGRLADFFHVSPLTFFEATTLNAG
ncbi:MAG: helix-turn-helix domain-containing protein [Pirellulales bacterium]|nr:helix-turn-helix domain-containing protein [Pirellulales bacterium]